ncbi:SANT/Myb-like DNA-binding domain-containing protein [Siminovitchia sp. 179-K 8D1 HS]|uniref:SANT/Myb-like DNA-binding domain-containing protein n=1 Tax=Siminovitchia sp. 179-K 8D1 HS TaxID=3142385 RepID=UPI0039A36964
MEETKECKKCLREFPRNTDYFYKKKDSKDGFTTKCKECNGQKFTKYHQLKEGEMFCKRCEKILPYNDEYFPKDKNTKTGLRNVCYVCSKGKTGSARYGKRKEKTPEWTKEEDSLLIEIYPDNRNEDIIDRFPNRTSKALIDRARLLGIKKSELGREKIYKTHSERMKEECHWIGKPKSNEEKAYLSQLMKKRWENDYENMLANAQYERTSELRDYMRKLRKQEGRWRGNNNPRHKNPLKGSDNPRWLGGITPLLFWFRNQLEDWKKDSMEFHNYTCVLTGKNFDEIHHLYSFREIVQETLDELDWQYGKTLEECSEDELEVLRETIIKNNKKYGLGVCLTKEVHKLYHDLYGYGGNTPEQFEEFMQKYRQGEFNEILNEGSVIMSD